MRNTLFVLLFSLFYLTPGYLAAQKPSYQAAGNGNPIIPGYFADPTVKKFNDTYYIYATTDGNGGGLGPAQVWTSKDFVNWTMQDMNWPTTHNYWAPDVALGNDGKYYLYYCQPTVEIYGASSLTPVGPWTPLFADNKAVVTNYLVPKVITLDGQTFKDDDGKYYMTWGTWGIYPGFGCGIGLLNADMKSFAKTAQIPNTLARDFFEGSFMFKRKGIYYLMYSSGFCENDTYRVQYATSKTGPMDGFTFGKNNPVLATSQDGSVDGPGHNSVLQIGEDYYIVYHRHNNPHSGGGYNRQVCADKLLFDADGNIEKVIPTHTGVGFLGKNSVPYTNLAYQKKVTASSFYNDDYKPEFAVDDNNGTLWKPKDNSAAAAWLQTDLGKVTHVKRVLTQFEYATWYYQYMIEYSADGKHWQLFSDKRNNHWHGSPAVDKHDVMARYLRLTITGTEYPGLYKAIWNMKIYGDGPSPIVPPNIHIARPAAKYAQKGLLIDIDANALPTGAIVNEWKNRGVLGGIFKTTGKAPFTDFVAGKKAVVFTGGQTLKSTFKVPLSLAGNSSYTVSFWAYTNQLKDDNPLLSWANGSEQLTGATFGYGSNHDFGAAQHGGFADIPYVKDTKLAVAWHHVAITFDGTFEKVYVDGQVNNQENKMLFVQLSGQFSLGSNDHAQNYFSGAIASLQVYDKPLSGIEVKRLYGKMSRANIAVYLDAAKLPYGKLTNWTNEGDAGGSASALKGEAIAEDIAGRISVRFPEPVSLKINEPLRIAAKYSMVVSKADPKTGKWHLITLIHQKNNTTIYIDGIKDHKSRLADGLRIDEVDNSVKGMSGAIAGLIVYRYALSIPEIKTLNDGWKQNLHPPMAAAPAFKNTPIAISPQMIKMEAASPIKNNSNLQYEFTGVDNDGNIKQSGWTSNPYYISYGCAANTTYTYRFKVRDFLGNVSGYGPAKKASTSPSNFTIYGDQFNQPKDYLETGTNNSIWDGLTGKGGRQSATQLFSNGKDTLKLESEGTSWDGNTPYGPFLYKKIKGNFIAEVEVTDITGLAQKKVSGNYEAGLMIRADNDLQASKINEQLIQNGIFPAYNVGNIFTNLIDGNRIQTNIQSAWKYNKYLQIQRDGNWFYVRTSNDKMNWTDMPGSPVLRADLNNRAVQVGLYQCSYGPKAAFACFSNFSLTLSK